MHSSQTHIDPRASSLRATINVTPLADVMLVLLIIFMVMTPLLGNSVHVEVPQSRFSSENPNGSDGDESLVLSLKRDGSIFLNRNRVPIEELDSTLPAALEGRRHAPLFLKADHLLDYRRVLELLSRCRRMGAVEVTLVTQPEVVTEQPVTP